jgi:hypothetical protein
VFKEGGKIQFAKGGKKIKKCQDSDGKVPDGTDVIDSSEVTATYTPSKQSGNLIGT